MRFYLVRHGETLLNAEHVRQGEGGSLSSRGKEQAERVGDSLARFPIRQIISSPFERAKETAFIINEHLHVPVVYSDLFVERKNPSEVIGKKTYDPEVSAIVDKIENSYHDDTYRYSDEENFIDLKMRAKKALAYLAWHGSKETCVVTHHVILKMLISYLLYRDRLTARDYAKLSFFNISDNAGISILDYHPWRMLNATRGWEVVSYNETP